MQILLWVAFLEPQKVFIFSFVITDWVSLLSINEIIKQELFVAEGNLEDKKKFGVVNIIGNRIMSKLMVEGDTKLMVLGWLLKEIGGELEGIKSQDDKAKLAEGKKSAKEFFSNVHGIISAEDVKVEKIYDTYLDYQKKIRKHLLEKPEDKVYNEDLEFTRKNTVFCLDYLVKEKDLLLDSRVQLPSRCTGDLARVLNEHGGKKPDYVTYILFRAFSKYFEYLLFEHYIEGVIQDKDKFGKTIDEYIKKFGNLKDQLDNETEFIKIADELLRDLGVKYREFFMKYGDIYREVSTVTGRKIDIPIDTREKIVDIVTKSFEEETK